MAKGRFYASGSCFISTFLCVYLPALFGAQLEAAPFSQRDSFWLALEAAPFSQKDSSWLALETVLGEQQVRRTPRVKHFMRVCSVASVVFDAL